MTGADILVIAMGVIAGGVGIFCFVSERLHLGKDNDATSTERKEGAGK